MNIIAMAPIINDNRTAVADLCRRYRVVRLELFGSAARDAFDPARSDLDFLVEFPPMTPGEHAKAYFALLADLEDLFGRNVDLVEAAAIRNPYFQRAVDCERVELYAA